MPTNGEVILATIAAADDRQRIQVVLRCDHLDGSSLELRQQSWGEGVGWFTQGTLTVEPGQIAQLRNILGRGHAGDDARMGSRRNRSLPSMANFAPRVLHAESA